MRQTLSFLIGRRQWFLGASTEWPGVVPADVEIGNLDELAGIYPSVAADLRAIAASAQHVVPSGGPLVRKASRATVQQTRGN